MRLVEDALELHGGCTLALHPIDDGLRSSQHSLPSSDVRGELREVCVLHRGQLARVFNLPGHMAAANAPVRMDERRHNRFAAGLLAHCIVVRRIAKGVLGIRVDPRDAEEEVHRGDAEACRRDVQRRTHQIILGIHIAAVLDETRQVLLVIVGRGEVHVLGRIKSFAKVPAVTQDHIAASVMVASDRSAQRGRAPEVRHVGVALVLEQHAHGGRVPFRACNVQRVPVEHGARVDRCAVREQVLEHVLLSVHRRRTDMIMLGAHARRRRVAPMARAVRLENAGDLEVLVEDCVGQRGPESGILGIHVHIGGQDELDDLLVPAARSEMQGAAAEEVAIIEIE
mmetsp:Transcript_18587/g.54422  ORF Transcript_18587/g.54422 Transcript_18587/m.54422 type:complete len:340 (-) Transcript_18587:625-1644(-)